MANNQHSCEIEIVKIETSGEWKPEEGEKRLSEAEGGKGQFAKEIEAAILMSSFSEEKGLLSTIVLTQVLETQHCSNLENASCSESELSWFNVIIISILVRLD